ncbi:hypothetical protein HDC92_002834 [Pedobacter sp. AK017]|uniref:DUF4134 family protein n=1 Tax=Pedobacter sp. AK017 TaxID=2723073 RepID=UPI00160C6D81|nr:DUF4134 family protein [Pedobacter sp. AK017]MBB5439147.1 hypothetical protein [Pedobacter sp. AK017]
MINTKNISIKTGKIWRKFLGKYLLVCFAILCANLLFSSLAFSQDGAAGINEATNKVKGYFDAGCNLMYAIGAVLGIIGAIKVLCAMNDLVV